MIRSLIRNALATAVQRDRFWKLFERYFVTVARFAEEQRWLLKDLPEQREFNQEYAKRLCPERCVLSGPFAGLEYPTAAAAGSSLLPKLLGTYEGELHAWIEEICDRGYTDVVNLGSGEGYYAVGLARRVPEARVFALDPNPRAQELCRDMAQRNSVADRVHVHGTRDAAGIGRLPHGDSPLLVCDCEGYEREVLNTEHAHRFAHWDILVETHDQLDLTISSGIKSAFAETHEVESVLSLDDVRKVHAYKLDVLEGLPLDVRRQVLAEDRGYVMEWLYLRSRSRRQVR